MIDLDRAHLPRLETLCLWTEVPVTVGCPCTEDDDRLN